MKAPLSSLDLRSRLEQPVADRPDRLDPSRRLGVIAELAPDRGDMHVDRAVECFKVALGDFKQELLARFHPSRHPREQDRKSTRLNSSHSQISYAVFCLKKKNMYN